MEDERLRDPKSEPLHSQTALLPSVGSLNLQASVRTFARAMSATMDSQQPLSEVNIRARAADRNGRTAILLFLLWFVMEMTALAWVRDNGGADWKIVAPAEVALLVPAILGLAYLKAASDQLADDSWKYSCACAYIIVAGITVPAIMYLTERNTLRSSYRSQSPP